MVDEYGRIEEIKCPNPKCSGKAIERVGCSYEILDDEGDVVDNDGKGFRCPKCFTQVEMPN